MININQRRLEDSECRNERRDSSNNSKSSSTNKFLKRKPDRNKIIEGITHKKKK